MPKQPDNPKITADEKDTSATATEEEAKAKQAAETAAAPIPEDFRRLFSMSSSANLRIQITPATPKEPDVLETLWEEVQESDRSASATARSLISARDEGLLIGSAHSQSMDSSYADILPNFIESNRSRAATETGSASASPPSLLRESVTDPTLGSDSIHLLSADALAFALPQSASQQSWSPGMALAPITVGDLTYLSLAAHQHGAVTVSVPKPMSRRGDLPSLAPVAAASPVSRTSPRPPSRRDPFRPFDHAPDDSKVAKEKELEAQGPHAAGQCEADKDSSDASTSLSKYKVEGGPSAQIRRNALADAAPFWTEDQKRRGVALESAAAASKLEPAKSAAKSDQSASCSWKCW